MAKTITENQKKLMQEAFKQGFESGKLGLWECDKAFQNIWSKLLETTFSKPEWKPYINSARSSYLFCFEAGYASGHFSGTIETAEQAFSDWFKVNFNAGTAFGR
jgi:hypothetical protein